MCIRKYLITILRTSCDGKQLDETRMSVYTEAPIGSS